jgi:hypothetical protein
MAGEQICEVGSALAPLETWGGTMMYGLRFSEKYKILV